MTEESAGVALAALLADAGYDVYVYDPAVADTTHTALENRVHCCGSIDELFAHCQVAVITTPWQVFAELPQEALASSSESRRVVIDCWRQLSEERYAGAIDIIRLGHHRSQVFEAEAL